jgi:hypothetical protein
MRSRLSELLISAIIGAVAAAIVISGVHRSQRDSQTGRYQLILGKTPGSNPPLDQPEKWNTTAPGEFNKMETIFRIDTVTGRTWQLLTNPHTVSYWWQIGGEGSDNPPGDPLLYKAGSGH